MQQKVFAVSLQTIKKLGAVKEDINKSEVRNLIITTALTLFIERGIKEVKMDDIAQHLSISKRTIYELFTDKEQLLHEAIKLQSETMRENAKKLIRCANNTLEIILGLYNLYLERLKKVNKNFFKELLRYPEICKSNRERETTNNKQFIAWMEMGRKQGLFRKDANFEILLFILRRDLETIFMVNMQAEKNELSKYTPDELGRMLILFYLRGISTAKGLEIIEEYLNKNETTK